MSNTIVLRALENELERVMGDMNLTADEYAVVYEDYPESHAFFGGDLYDMHSDDLEVVELVMDKDVNKKVSWLMTVLGELSEPGVREEGGLLFGCDGYADMQAEMASERAVGC